VKTKALPNFDTSRTPTTASINANSLTSWAAIVGAGLRSELHRHGDLDGMRRCGCVGMYEKAVNGWRSTRLRRTASFVGRTYLLGMQNATYRDQLRAVTVGNADIAGRMPIHYREADSSAGTGQFFDQPGTGLGKPPIAGTGSVGTFGRVLSLNARQQLRLSDPATTLLRPARATR
jgi:hypothetical protein